MFKELKLFPRRKTSDGTTVVYASSADIDYDVFGNFILCDSIEGLSQVVVKAVITKSQPDGYGTMLQTLKGTKNKPLLKALLTMEIIRCYNVVKNNQIIFLNKYPLLDREQIIANVQYVKVISPSLTSIKITLRVQSLQQRQLNPLSTNIINVQL